jgi:hypothetical protein
MKSIEIIFMAIVTTIILFGVAITVGNIVYRIMCAVYNRIKKA